MQEFKLFLLQHGEALLRSHRDASPPTRLDTNIKALAFPKPGSCSDAILYLISPGQSAKCCPTSQVQIIPTLLSSCFLIILKIRIMKPVI